MQGIFDDTKLRMNVNVQGTFKEYAEYKRSQRINPKMLRIILFITFTTAIGIVVMLLIHSAFALPPAPSTFWADFLQVALIGTQMSWSSFAKFFLVLMMPVIAISWLFHGVQTRLLA